MFDEYKVDVIPKGYQEFVLHKNISKHFQWSAIIRRVRIKYPAFKITQCALSCNSSTSIICVMSSLTNVENGVGQAKDLLRAVHRH